MRILVTGSTGTLGRPLVKELRARGHEVWGCSRHHSDAENHVRADVAERRQLDRAFLESDPDIVYHLAAEFGRLNGEEYYEQLWTSNVIGTRNVLELCANYTSRLIFASSSEVYGENPRTQAIVYPDDRGVIEYIEEYIDRPPQHHNEYAISKYTNELQIDNYVKRTDLEVCTLRFFNAYGPGEEYHPYRSVVALFCYRALHGIPWEVYQGYSRTFMYIDDFIPTLANVSDRFTQGVYNVGGTDYRSVEELSSLIIKAVNADPSLARLLPREEHNVVSKRPDISRAAQDFGHHPRVGLEVGVPLTLDWMRSRYGV